MSIQDKRILVAGASSGVGRELARRAAQAGAHVVASARRGERLAELEQEAPGRLHGVVADIRSEADCARLARTAIETLGGLDALVVAAGMSHFGSLVDADADIWRETLETNLIGPTRLCAHALEALSAARGMAIFISSVSADSPRPFLVPYGASKAALDATILGWRNEHPGMRFVRVPLGPTVSEFSVGWDPAEKEKFRAAQRAQGREPPAKMGADIVADELIHIIGSPVRLDDVRMMPVVGDSPPPWR